MVHTEKGTSESYINRVHSESYINRVQKKAILIGYIQKN